MASASWSSNASRSAMRDSRLSPERRSQQVTFDPVSTPPVSVYVRGIEYDGIINIIDDGECNGSTDDRERGLPSAQEEQDALEQIRRVEEARAVERGEGQGTGQGDEQHGDPGAAPGKAGKLSMEDLTISALERYDALRALNGVDPDVVAMFCDPVASERQRDAVMTFDSAAEQFNVRLSRPVSWSVFRRFQYRVHILYRKINRLTSEDAMMLRLKNNSTGFYVGIYFRTHLIIRIEMQNLLSISRRHNIVSLTVSDMICVQQRFGDGDVVLALSLRDVEAATRFMGDMERARGWLSEE